MKFGMVRWNAGFATSFRLFALAAVLPRLTAACGDSENPDPARGSAANAGRGGTNAGRGGTNAGGGAPDASGRGGGQGATDGTGGSGGPGSADSGGAAGSGGADSSTDGTSADSGVPDSGAPDSADGGDLQPGSGVQIVTKDLVVPANSEVFRCYRVTLPGSAEAKVQRFVSRLVPGTQQRFTLYRSSDVPPVGGAWQNSSCTGGSSWLYAARAPDYELALPAGVAMTLAARQSLAFDTQYLNSTSQPITVRIAINLHFVSGPTQEADALVAFHTGISVAPDGGVQSVSATCTPGPGAKFFSMTVHTHQYATEAVLGRRLANGTPGETFVQTADWRSPAELRRSSEPFVTFAPGEQLTYGCSYLNTRMARLLVGTSFVTNEQCMAISYFFPASAAGSCSGS
jgi:hypothetical protein